MSRVTVTVDFGPDETNRIEVTVEANGRTNRDLIAVAADGADKAAATFGEEGR